jgi:hypothetical protein
MRCCFLLLFALLPVWIGSAGQANSPQRYYAHNAVLDRQGVIAPWYQGQNGQCDLRVGIAVETLKRYPWAEGEQSVTPAPHFIFNGHWHMDNDGSITVSKPAGEARNKRGILQRDWINGDLGPRAAQIITAMVEYYRYSGDPVAFSYVHLTADYLMDHCLTPADHPWPNFPVSVPTAGEMYFNCRPNGFIQLDHVGEIGLALIRAYKLTGNEHWLAALMHWGDLLAERCDLAPGARPWPRYANPQDVPWGAEPDGNIMTGGAVWVTEFLEELIALGHTGKDGILVKARDAGRRYLREKLLPRWHEDPTWGYNYWDWKSPTSNQNIVCQACRYLMHHPELFPNWKNDARNIMTIMLNRTSANPVAKGGVHAGAWQHPESTSCCGDASGYGPQRTAGLFLEYASLTGSEWAREIGRRMAILSSYDILENGRVIDSLFTEKPRVAGSWYKIAVLNPVVFYIRNMGFLPVELGASRENHIMRSASVVQTVVYGKGTINYTTFDAPSPCMDVLRLAFEPKTVRADSQALEKSSSLGSNGYQVQPLPNGDFLLTIRHDGAREVSLTGDDPQEEIDDGRLKFDGEWAVSKNKNDLGNGVRVASRPGASASYTFRGNQVRLLGRADPDGGRAEVHLDGQKQSAGVDFWCPTPRFRHVLFTRTGLAAGEHTLKVVAAGKRNPVSRGDKVYIDGIQSSAAEGTSGCGEGGGPTGAQRFLLGYAGREDYVDSAGHTWRPSSEVECVLASRIDTVTTTWWTKPRAETIAGTADPELYRYGMHAPDFTVQFTVGPGTYLARLRFAETRPDLPAAQRAVSIEINGKEAVTSMDIAATAGGSNRAADLVFNGIHPRHGMISIRFRNSSKGEAIAQAVEIGPGNGGEGAKPVRAGQ